jgi:MFS family permease
MAVATPAILMQPLGLFLKPMTGEFGWTRTQFSSIIAIAALCNALIVPIAGYLVDRFGAPRIIAIGTLIGCSAYAALSLASSYTMFIAIMTIAVIGGNLASYPAFMGLAQRWFDQNLGRALAITSTGLAVGVASASYVITRAIAQQDWRAAFVSVGIAALVIGLTNLVFFIRDTPVPIKDEDATKANGETLSLTLSEAVRTRDFWLYGSSFTLIIFAVVACNVHLPAMLSDRGATPQLIGSIVGTGAAGSLFGRLFTGMLLDRFSVRNVAVVFLAGQVVGFLALRDGLQWVLPASFLLGAVQGAEIDIMGFVIARRFGRLAYGRIFGTCFGITLIGAIIGPLAMGTIFDQTGSYDLGLVLLPIVPVIAFGLLCLVKPLSRQTAISR